MGIKKDGLLEWVPVGLNTRYASVALRPPPHVHVTAIQDEKPLPTTQSSQMLTSERGRIPSAAVYTSHYKPVLVLGSLHGCTCAKTRNSLSSYLVKAHTRQNIHHPRLALTVGERSTVRKAAFSAVRRLGRFSSPGQV